MVIYSLGKDISKYGITSGQWTQVSNCPEPLAADGTSADPSPLPSEFGITATVFSSRTGANSLGKDPAPAFD
ncbi:MAG: hypothetical protein E5W83_14955 [Mesorhizobium sp.]|nr:MAG: hypothetical protein E5W83_14955 [Mesorhizobium sp.]